MSDQIGYTFTPGSSDDFRRRINGLQFGPLANAALKIISLRLPAVLAGRPISVDQMLRPNVGGVAPQNALLDSLRQVSGVAASRGVSGGGVFGRGGASETASLADLIANALGTGSGIGSVRPPTITPGSAPQPPEAPTPSAPPADSLPGSLSPVEEPPRRSPFGGGYPGYSPF